MKLLFATLLCLLTLSHAHSQVWPRNSTTGKVEFRGLLPWPASAKTEAQRRALVRRWYLSKLTDESAQAVDEGVRTVVSPTLLTYAKLPIIAILQHGQEEDAILLSYTIDLVPNRQGLNYTFSRLTWAVSKDVEAHISFPIEEVIAGNNPNEMPTAIALRHRLAAAVAHW